MENKGRSAGTTRKKKENGRGERSKEADRIAMQIKIWITEQAGNKSKTKLKKKRWRRRNKRKKGERGRGSKE